jgi:Cu2+-exporting ATPase
VIATGRLFRSGILFKAPTALERLGTIDHVVFDKTGTVTEPELALVGGAEDDPGLREAAALAVSSRHPLARALAAAVPGVAPWENVAEHAGLGLSLQTPQGEVRFGSRAFCGIEGADPADGPEIWLTRPGEPPRCFQFRERIRAGAATTLKGLRRLGVECELLSGDRSEAVAVVAASLGISKWRAGRTPIDKAAYLETLAGQGRRVLMVGDGLNDGPALAAAAASMSPATGADISQNVADVVFQRSDLLPVLEAVLAARRARQLILQNIGFAICYNFIAVPLAICGMLTPWIAAAAMSSSSLIVIGNSFRFPRRSAP